MKITPVNCNISFQRIQMKDNKGIKIFDNLKCSSDSRNFDEQNVSINPFARYNYNNYRIEFKNKKRGLTAQENIGLYPWTDYLFINNMDSFYERCGLGTCMHLINIIEMLENNINTIHLNALPTAASFHAKFGFYPDGKWNEGLSENIKELWLYAGDEFDDLASKAKILLNSNNSDTLSDEGNKLLYKYLRRANKILSKEEQMNLLRNSIHMKLTKETVLKNKDYYNSLFKKYNIDYRID